MSQKSTARTGSEGDAEFKATRNTDVHSGSSSCKTKRDIFGGPFGDSPLINQAQEAYQDYLVIMLRNNEDTPGTSESSQADLDLYNLRNNYTEQLNLVRKKLNLMELKEEEPQRCTITEIVEDEPSISKKDEDVQVDECSTPPRPTLAEKIAKELNRPKEEYELTTIHPFSLNYNLQSGSSTNIFEPDYSPPKKKVCQRLKTPRFVSTSETSLPHQIKIDIHESMFRKQSPLRDKKDIKGVTDKEAPFCENRETQCNEEDINRSTKSSVHQFRKRSVSSRSQSTSGKYSILDLSFETETEETIEESVTSEESQSCGEKQLSGHKSKSSERPISGVIFPNVIIENKTKFAEESSLSTRSKKCTTSSSSNKDSFRKDSEGNVLSLNSVRDSSDEDSSPVKVMNTTIDTSDKLSKTKKMSFKKQNKIQSSEKATMWEELTRLRSGTDENKVEKAGDGAVDETGDATYDICKLTNYVSQLSQNINLGEIIRNESEISIKSGGKTKLNRYIRQYVQYKREVEGIKPESAKKRNKHTIIGQRLVNIQNRIMDSPDKLYQSETSLVSDEEKCEKLSSTPGDTSETEERRNVWDRICVCLCPRRYIAD